MESLRWKREIMAEEETKINCHEKRQPSHSSSGKRRGRQFRSSRVKHETRRDLFCSMSILLFVLLAVQKEFNCLRISSIGIPPAILNGSQTTLECNYELGPGDQLYSVTWYKDRVGFYRYQPAAGETQEQTATTTSVEQRGQNLNLNYQSHHQAPIVAPPNAKHEFDWAGISLDLARSNSTHVHLKQVGLNSEGTFECEVIADAPTFATVSASRQMRVYVLPKRKLSMTDNSQQVTSQSSLSLQNQNQDQLQSPSQQQHQLFRQNLYQLNDLLNFTCVSGPSRPAARLSWFLNDLPIAAFIQQTGTIPNRGSHEPSNQNSQNNNQEHRGSIWADNQTTSKSTDSLVETRSTLVLRLQASHLRQLRAKASQQQRQRSVGGAGGSYLPLKLSCVSQLSVEFSSNTSLLISGGKTSTMKRSRNPPADSAGAPEASSWRLEQGGGGTATTLANSRRRPEPQDAPLSGEDDDQEMGSLDSDRMDSHQNSIFRWPPAAASSSTGRQRPKQGPDYDVSSSAAPPGGLETNYHSDGELAPSVSRKPPRNLVVWTNRQLRDQSDHIERLLAKSSANELESAHIEAQTVRAASDMRGRPVPVDEPEQENGWPSSSSPSQQHQHESAKLNNNDYQLYELVNFTCQQEDRGDDGGDGPERMHNVHLKWFLNDRELSGDIINAYEPARGFYFEPSESIQQLSDGNGRATGNWSASGQHAHIQRSSGSDQVGGGELATSRSLLIEFSPNLFRLRELSLRCTTIIEQPLIEFESVQWLYLATSPFIQAHDNHHQQQQNQSPRPSLYNVNSRHRQQHPHRQPGQQQRQSPGNVIKMRHQSSRTSASSSSSLSGSTLAGSSLLTQGGGRLVYLLVTIWFSLMLAFAVPILHLDTTSTMLRRG